MRTIPLIFVAAIVGCSSAGDQAGPLTGTWGGPSLNVSAGSGTVLLTLTCGANIKVAHPIFVDGDGKFTVVDSLRGKLGGGGATDTLPGVLPHSPVQAVQLNGQIAGDVLTITFQVDFAEGNVVLPFTFTATKGQPGNTFEVCRV